MSEACKLLKKGGEPSVLGSLKQEISEGKKLFEERWLDLVRAAADNGIILTSESKEFAEKLIGKAEPVAGLKSKKDEPLDGKTKIEYNEKGEIISKKSKI